MVRRVVLYISELSRFAPELRLPSRLHCGDIAFGVRLSSRFCCGDLPSVHACLFSFVRKKETACDILRFYSAGRDRHSRVLAVLTRLSGVAGTRSWSARRCAFCRRVCLRFALVLAVLAGRFAVVHAGVCGSVAVFCLRSRLSFFLCQEKRDGLRCVAFLFRRVEIAIRAFSRCWRGYLPR